MAACEHILRLGPGDSATSAKLRTHYSTFKRTIVRLPQNTFFNELPALQTAKAACSDFL